MPPSQRARAALTVTALLGVSLSLIPGCAGILIPEPGAWGYGPPAPKPDPTPLNNGCLTIALADPGSAAAPANATVTFPIPPGKTATAVSLDLKIPASVPVGTFRTGWFPGAGSSTPPPASPPPPAGESQQPQNDGAWHTYAARDLHVTGGGVGFTLGAPAGSTLSGAKVSVDNFIVTYVDGSTDMLRFDEGASPSVLAVTTDVSSNKVTTNIDSTDGSSPVKVHGALKVVGSEIQDQYGKPVQLKGMSLFWSQWSGWFWNAKLVNNLARDWNATVIRAAMAVEENKGGFLGDPRQRALAERVVDAALANGIYVIIDWHYTDSAMYTEDAKKFFRAMAIQYGQKPNVIFEIFNEPLASNDWPGLKKYSEAVVAEIRAAGSQNLVLIPSPSWDQRVDMPATDPLNPATFGNIAYSLHFYAGSHGGTLRDTAEFAMSKGVPVFVSEWGTSDASGGDNHHLYLDEARPWLDWMDQHHISSCNWSMFNKDESASALTPNASYTGPWTPGMLTASGAFVKSYLLGTLPKPAAGTKAP